jgi:hypothetical protein
VKLHVPKIPASRRPMRDSLIAYGALAVLIVVISTITGGDMARALFAAAAFFVAASAWAWWRAKRRAERERAR